MATREEIYASLFELVTNAVKFKTQSRKIKSFSQVQPSEMPAIFQLQTSEVYDQTARGLPPKKFFYVELYIYVAAMNAQDIPSQKLNVILDSIETALAPEPASDVQTLGGTVSHAWISGKIETDEGTLGNISVAIVPIEILVTV